MKLALGTVQFGLPYGIANQSGQVSRDDAKTIISLARLCGIDTLDTAIAYGDSEACLGEIGVDDFKVITKLPAIPENVPDIALWVQEQMQTSLQRLHMTSVYGLLLHRSQQLLGDKGKALSMAIEQLKAEGVVQKFGVSIYAPSELDNVMNVCQIDLVQAPFNLIDQRLYTSGWLKKLHDTGVGVHTRSAFLQGLLLMPKTEIPEKFKQWSSLWSIWHDWLRVNETTAVQACVGFVQSFPQIDKIVLGVDSLNQLQQLIIASKIGHQKVWPTIVSDDENLINPSNWSNL